MSAPRCFRPGVLLFIQFLLVMAVSAADKPVRLRNEVILPQPSAAAISAAPRAPRDDTKTSGLFLVQFAGPVTPAWKNQLQQLGVELLRYVPEDAFVAQFNNVSAQAVRRLSFVRWVGTYRPEHKVHGGLQTGAGALRAADSELEVAVVLSPRATEADAARSRQAFAAISQEANHRFGRVVRGRLGAAQLNALAASDAVLWIEPVRPMKLMDEVSSRIVAGEGPPNQTLMQSLGYNGAGVTVAVADSGLDSGDTNSMHPDIQGRVKALFHYGAPGQLEDAADEHSHGTHVAGIIAGNGAVGETDENGFLYGLGVAPGAGLIGQRLFDAVGGYAAPPSFERMTRDAKRAGADIGSNSWGDDTQGRYDISAMEFDALVRDADALALGDQPYILEFSAGNAGPNRQTVGSPAVAKNVIATGASNNDRQNLPLEEFPIYADGPDSMADFSSRGPCEDGRIKPDVVAPGSWIASLRSIYANDENAWWPISDSYLYQGGTSQAGPQVSGAAAVFVQFYRETHAGATPSPALVKAALINSAADMTDGLGTDAVPNNDEGWGRVDLPALIASPRDYAFVDQTVGLTNGAMFEQRILVGSADEPLKITLTYTDVPGFPAAVPALVNDLDLEVQSPDGRVYRGNQFFDGESVPNAAGADRINNVEAVHLGAPVPGEYILRVRGWRVVEDARQDTAVVDQDFALVVSASAGVAGVGIVTFDRRVYRAPDRIQLALVDADLAGRGTVDLVVRSTVEPLGETVTLAAMGGGGSFTGSVLTATGPALPDGKLQLAHGNAIEAVYSDAQPSGARVFAAAADLLPPTISDVRSTSQFGQILVSWTTDEPAVATVYHGTNVLNRVASNAVFDVSHELPLSDVSPNSVQRFFVVSTDAAGNRATNDNGGLFFAVTNSQSAEVLLIDSFADYFGIIFPPPLEGYTDALDALGVAYDVFDATVGAEPAFAQLQGYRCVIWRVSDLEPPSPTLAQSISDYVNGGGSLFVASMEALSRFEEGGLAGFNTGVFQVQGFVTDQPVDFILGVSGEAVGAGIDTDLDYEPYAEILAVAGTSDPSDWIEVNTNAAEAIRSGDAVVGLRAPRTGLDLPGRVVFLSFPLDAVPMGSGVGNNRPGLLRNALNFLAPKPGNSALTFDSGVYSVPGRVTAEVDDADLQGGRTVSILVASQQLTNDVLVTLQETSRPGLFRGSFLLTPTNSGAFGTLYSQSGDTIHASYSDLSSGTIVTASATVETNPPAISDVSIEPGYLEAVVSWSTSEEADSLVQYSEAPDNFPINFVAYDAARTTEHAVTLTGLQPNRTYYARVVSRDRAGNSAMDDNDGHFHQFTTLEPKPLPWFDNAETNSAEWSVFASDGSETEWMRGAPGGGEPAHSTNNCWGSNLDGGVIGLAETYLVSPGILLNGGNRATLRFWHNFDFLGESETRIELATVEVITNVASPSVLLWQLPMNDASFGWEEVELDLTPYLGQVVYIVWYYFLFSGEDVPRPGWLVDDVSISVTNIQPGTIDITNNLWQSVFALAGPSGRNGNGLQLRITNAAPGEYTIEYGDVPHFQTPAPQTKTLPAGGSVTFAGSYTFADLNTNGLPDGWELAMFGDMNPERTSGKDSDGDGMSDWAEFVAGTHPNLPPPPFSVSARQVSAGTIELTWPAVSNHVYRIYSSTNLDVWKPLAAGVTLTGVKASATVNAASMQEFFRVEDVTGENGPAAVFQLNASKLSDGAVKLDWPSATGHGYRVFTSSNLSDWTPASAWIRANSSRTSFTNATSGGPQFFRVEAQP